MCSYAFWFGKFFAEVGKPVEAGTFLPPPPMEPEAMKKMQEIGQKYGQELFPPDYLNQVDFTRAKGPTRAGF